MKKLIFGVFIFSLIISCVTQKEVQKISKESLDERGILILAGRGNEYTKRFIKHFEPWLKQAEQFECIGYDDLIKKYPDYPFKIVDMEFKHNKWITKKELSSTEMEKILDMSRQLETRYTLVLNQVAFNSALNSREQIKFFTFYYLIDVDTMETINSELFWHESDILRTWFFKSKKKIDKEGKELYEETLNKISQDIWSSVKDLIE